MDYELSNRQKQICLAAREFAEGEFPKYAKEGDSNEIFPEELRKKASELGLIGVYIEKEYGGAGLGCLEHSLIMEEFWRVDQGCGNILLTCAGSEIIQMFGTEEQKKKYLPLIAKGQAISCTAAT